MACTCRMIFIVLSALSLLISIPIICMGLSMRKGSQTKCDTDIYPHMLAEGIAMLILSLIAIIGVAKRIKFLIWLFIALTIFEFIYIVIGSTTGYHSMYTEQGRQAHYWDHDEYNLHHFREDVKSHYLNDVAWAGHKSCFRHANLCSNQYDHNLTLWKTSNPVRYACCGPPLHCGYTHDMNGKGFVAPKKGQSSPDRDCVLYSNHAEQRCYDCDICKAAFLVIEVGDMQRLNMVIIIVNVMFTVQLMMACSAMETINSIEDSDINNPMYRRYRR